jgi:cyanophycinase
MPGTVVLQGGGPFSLHDDLDRRLLGSVGAERVVVLPTADAFERPEVLIAAGMSWAERLEIDIDVLMVMSRPEAMDSGAAEVVRSARAVWLVGDNPIHLRSVVKDTPVWEALLAVLSDGGVVVGAGPSASALCDPMIDPRGGALALGLGLVKGLALVSQSETVTADRQARARKLANVPLAFLPSSSALLRTDSGWESIGTHELVGTLPN